MKPKLQPYRAVELRCGLRASVQLFLHYPWHWLGIDNEGHPHLWKENGSWLESGKPHSNDILRFVFS